MRKRKRKSRKELEVQTAIELLKLFAAMLNLLDNFLKLLLAMKE